MLELSQHHGPVLVLIVQLEALEEVLEGALVLGLLDLGVDLVELLQGDVLLALLLGAAQALDSLEGGVLVHAAEAVAQVEQVHAGLALKVIDVERELGAWGKEGEE